MHTVWSGLQSCLFWFLYRWYSICPEQRFNYFPLILLPGLLLAPRGQCWATNLTSTQTSTIQLKVQTHLQVYSWNLHHKLLYLLVVWKLLFHLLKGLHESPEQVSYFLQQLLNSSLSFAQPENMNHVTGAWLPPMWLPSSPPRTALRYFLLCLRSLKKPHEHQYKSKGLLLIWMFSFSARSPAMGSFHPLIVWINKNE